MNHTNNLDPEAAVKLGVYLDIAPNPTNLFKPA